MVANAKPPPIPWWKTSLGEEEKRRLLDAIDSQCLSQGPVTSEFETLAAKKLDVPFATATNSGSVALLMSLRAAGVGHGDEVIVPSSTWIATAHAVLMLGARVVLVDAKPDTPIIDASRIAAKITPRTKAILPVHLGGRSADMEAIGAIAAEHGLPVIEDAAQAIFSKNGDDFLGTNSFAGCFSLSPAKLITTGQGGIIVTRDEETHRKLRLFKTHGVDDIINVAFTEPGFNFKFTDLQAAIGIGQLGRVARRVEHLRNIYAAYEAASRELPFLEMIEVDISRGEIPLFVEVLCDDRDRLIRFLSSRDIGTRPFYPELNRAPYLRNGESFPNSEKFGRRGLFLPGGPEQPLDNVDRVIRTLKSFRR
ncbi:DegT/DnrJ/EryC1/StrS family aminotransferase [Elusimicrobiota bacterium]